MMRERMQRVTRKKPCPICNHTDWCLVAPDGSTAICQRVKDGSVKKCGDAGYLHILEDRHNRHDGHKHGVRRCHVLKACCQTSDGATDFVTMAARYQSQLTSEGLHALSQSLGASPQSLQRLGVGWDGSAYTFGMSNDSCEVIGIRRRFVNGGKASVKGSKTGLFIPLDLSGNGPLLLCEGATDTAAALDLGFDAIGRPNCNSIVQMTVKAAKSRTEVVVVADNDPAGKAGAQKLAGTLALHGPCVKIIAPPDKVKDLRQWLNAGLTAQVLQEVITAAPPISVKVSFSHTDEGKEVRR